MNTSGNNPHKQTSAHLDDVFDQYTLDDWREIAEKSLRGDTIESLSKCSAGGLNTRALFTSRPESSSQLPSSALQRWDNRLCLIHGSPQSQNDHLLEGLQGGISSVQFNLDQRQEHYAVSLDSLVTVSRNVQLELIPVSLKPGDGFVESAIQLEALWNSQNIEHEKALGAINADPLGTIAATGDTSADLDTQLRAMGKLAHQWSTRYPNATSVCVDTSCYHNAGASIEQELIASIATATQYMQSMLDTGMDATSAHNALVFQVATDADTIANVVKLRTLKRLWHHVSSHMGVQQPITNLVVETSRRMQSRSEPWVNHLRNISAATAAAMAGAQSIVVHPHNFIDGAFIDSETQISTRMARNIAIILSQESHMTFVNDPMGGSYAVESIGSELCEKIWHHLQQLENDGGFIKQLTSGQWQQSIAEYQQKRVARLRENLDIQVGVNKYRQNLSSDETGTHAANTNPAISSNALRTNRDAIEFEVGDCE